MELIKQIAEEIKKQDGRALLVGGYVRDKFLGLKSKDYDLEVFNMKSDDLIPTLKKFGKVDLVGAHFGVLKLNNEIDISMPRRERKQGKGYRGFAVSIDPYMSYKEACSRRDLTINAMMLDPLTNELIDPFDGLVDLKNKVLRHVNSKTFAEDPLRILRVAQFRGRFEFKTDILTLLLCEQLIPELKYLSKERIFIELQKMLMKSDRPSLAFRWMYAFGILEELFPELYILDSVKQGRKYHPEGSVFVHTMLTIDAVPKEKRTLPLMLAALLHDTGKAVIGGIPSKTDPDHIHFKGHAEEGAIVATAFLKKLTTDKKLIEEVTTLVLYHMRPYEIARNLHKKHVRRLALKVDIPTLLELYKADKRGRGTVNLDMSFVNKIFEMYHEIKNEIRPILRGRHLIDHLGLEPGKYFGDILRKSFDLQLDGQLTTLAECLEYVKLNF